MSTEIEPRRLAHLADEIRTEVDAAEADFQSALQHAIRAGELLIEAKAQVEHGQWLPWLEANFSKSPRSAQGYMRLAENAEDAQRVAHLGLKGALRELAAPRETLEAASAEAPDAFARWEELVCAPPREQDYADRWGYINACIDHSFEVQRAVAEGCVALSGMTPPTPIHVPAYAAAGRYGHLLLTEKNAEEAWSRGDEGARATVEALRPAREAAGVMFKELISEAVIAEEAR